jgi:simple sugar transport system permease protein
MNAFISQLDPVSLLSLTLITATPLTLAALGGMMCERSGVVNIALEGIMLTGAFIGYGVAFFTHNLWLGVLAAVAAGMGASVGDVAVVLAATDGPALAGEARAVSERAMSAGRLLFRAYGSCSTSEPREEAAALGLLGE